MVYENTEMNNVYFVIWIIITTLLRLMNLCKKYLITETKYGLKNCSKISKHTQLTYLAKLKASSTSWALFITGITCTTDVICQKQIYNLQTLKRLLELL